jgi:hypothetical protein
MSRTHPDAQEAQARAETRRRGDEALRADEASLVAERAEMSQAFRRSATLGGANPNPRWTNSVGVLELSYSGKSRVYADPADGAAGGVEVSTIAPLARTLPRSAILLPAAARMNASPSRLHTPARAGLGDARPASAGGKHGAYIVGAKGTAQRVREALSAREFRF